MATEISIDQFLPHVGEVFSVIVSETHELKVLLSEVTRLVSDGSALRKRVPFSLTFHAAPGSHIPQQIYRLEHEGMEPFDCFLVPIQPDSNGARFEAIYT